MREIRAYGSVGAPEGNLRRYPAVLWCCRHPSGAYREPARPEPRALGSLNSSSRHRRCSFVNRNWRAGRVPDKLFANGRWFRGRWSTSP